MQVKTCMSGGGRRRPCLLQAGGENDVHLTKIWSLILSERCAYYGLPSLCKRVDSGQCQWCNQAPVELTDAHRIRSIPAMIDGHEASSTSFSATTIMDPPGQHSTNPHGARTDFFLGATGWNVDELRIQNRNYVQYNVNGQSIGESECPLQIGTSAD